MVNAFFYSGGCFSVGLLLACVVSFSSFFTKNKNDENNNNNNNNSKAIDESDLNKNLIQNKA
jgi:hypothetical protein